LLRLSSWPTGHFAQACAVNLINRSGGYARLNDAQRALLRQPETRAALFALLDGDEWRARRLAHELEAL
jgi:hypothetical protein